MKNSPESVVVTIANVPCGFLLTQERLDTMTREYSVKGRVLSEKEVVELFK